VIIQRFGGALNLNVHIHALVIDGVFAHDGEPLRFQSARRLTRDDVAEVVAVVAHLIDRLLQRRGVMAPSEESGGADRWAEEAPVDEHGRLKPIHQMPLEVRRVIESVEVVRRNLTVGDGTQEHVYKVKLISKGRMHELLARHVGLFEPEPPRAAQVPAFVFTDCPGIAVH